MKKHTTCIKDFPFKIISSDILSVLTYIHMQFLIYVYSLKKYILKPDGHIRIYFTNTKFNFRMIYALPFSLCKLSPVRSDQMLLKLVEYFIKERDETGKVLEGGIKSDQNKEWPLVACYVKLH